MTGANVGLGYETTKELLKRGATVIMACRSEQNARDAIAKIRRKISEGEVEFMELDLGDFDSIRNFSSNIKAKYPKFQCLLNNAGVASRKKTTTKHGLELNMGNENVNEFSDFFFVIMKLFCNLSDKICIFISSLFSPTGTNHLGHYYLTRLLMENIKANKSRVVVVSSKLHEKGVIDFESFGKITDAKRSGYYDDSKLMNFYFAKELYKRGFDCHVLCPGLCFTNLFRDFQPKFYHYIILSPFILWFLRSAEQGAQNILHCALDNINDADKNPSNSYIVMNLKQTKSKITLDDHVSERLWLESAKLCELDDN